VLTTVASIVSAIALLLPGFIITELSVARSARGSRSDLELALRALSYTLIVHLVFGFWTVHLISTVGSPAHWTHHWGALAAYGSVVLIAVPVILGSLLNRYLARVESRDGRRTCLRRPSALARRAMHSISPISGGAGTAGT
jgi:hypothetical protein